jgi:hypothetical protein
MNILINISQISIITGDNPYQSKRDFLISFWEKFNKNDFDEYKEKIKFIKDNDLEIIKKLSNKNKINIESELKNCLESNNINDLDKNKKELFEKIDNLSEIEKKEITKSIKNVTNTNFGIKNENDITKLYENISGNIFLKDDIYRKKVIIKNNIFNLYIGGKIDGIDSNKTYIIEIKNRVKNLFYKLKEYEKVQIMCYLYLFSIDKGHLVEALKNNSSTDINIIEVLYDKNYMDNIIKKLIIFSNFFVNFFNNDIMKKNLLLKKDEINFD